VKKTIIFIILFLPIVASAQEKQQWTIMLHDQTITGSYFFELPTFKDEFPVHYYSLKYYQGIRFTIRPTFGEQVAYELLYTPVENDIPQEIKDRISKHIDLKHVLFLKYEISYDSKKAIKKYMENKYLGNKVFGIDNAFEELEIVVTAKLLPDFFSTMEELEINALNGFNNFESQRGFDGTTYTIEVSLMKNSSLLKFELWSPIHNTQEGKFIEELVQLFNSL
jgi:hypothetical protein